MRFSLMLVPLCHPIPDFLGASSGSSPGINPSVGAWHCIREPLQDSLFSAFIGPSLVCSKVKLLSRVRLLVTLWTIPPRFLCPWDIPGNNIGVGCHFLLQGISPTQGLNLGLLHCRQTLYRLRHQRLYMFWSKLNISNSLSLGCLFISGFSK